MEASETTLGQAAEASHHRVGQLVVGLAKRPTIDYQMNCKSISIISNYVKAEFQKDISELFLLRLDFSPIIEADNRVLREKLIAISKPQLVACLGNRFLINGSYMFSAQKPNFITETILKLVYLKGTYTLTIRVVKSAKIDPSEEGNGGSLFILNKLIRGMMKSLNFNDFLENQQFFDPTSLAHKKIDGTNLTLLKGWRPQFTNGKDGIHMKLEQTQIISRNESILSYINQIYQLNSSLSKDEKRQLVKKRLIGQIVMCNYGGFRKVFIKDVVFDKSVKEVKLSDQIPLPETSKNEETTSTEHASSQLAAQSNNGFYPRLKRSWDTSSQEVSLFDYFYNKYGMKIKFEKQPLLVVSDRQQRDHFYYVPELSVLLGIPEELTEFQLKSISEAKIQKPEELFKNLSQFIDRLFKDSSPSIPELNDSVNLNVERKPLVIKAKQIASPILTFGLGGAKKDTRITLDDASSGFMMKYPVFANPNNPIQIALLHFNDFDPKELLSVNKQTNFILFSLKIRVFMYLNTLIVSEQNWNKTQRELKIDVKRPIEFNLGEYNSKAVQEIELVLKKEVKKEKFDIIALVAPPGLSTPSNYAKIKRICTIQQQMKSQFIKQSTLDTKNVMTASTGILTQMAAKCGAALWVAQPPGGFPDKTLILSTSTHKTVINGLEQYVIGFVATQDINASKFYSRAVFQTIDKNSKSDWVRVEKIRQFLTDAVKQYFVMNKFVPEQIIYLRENVPSSNLKEFLASEVNEIMKSFTDLSQAYTPALCVILLSTKHSLRCFSAAPNSFADSNYDQITNPLQGTLIDNTVTSRFLYDFYMISQNQKEGTSIPVRYKVAYDSTSLPEGKLQELLYSQCFNYVNWNGAIKYPAPYMYAKKLAKVVANYLLEEIPASLHSSRFYI